MNNSEKYELLTEGEIFQPSMMGVVPVATGGNFSKKEIESKLRSCKDFELISFEEEASEEGTESYVTTITYRQEEYTVNIGTGKVSDIHLDEYALGNMVEEDDINIAMSQPYFIEVSLFFSGKPLDSFHFQLKLLNAIVPNASLVVDFASFRLLSGKWLKMTASSSIPPSPDYLYSLHAVYDEKNGVTEYWFHTHGLLRCGIIELEILNVKSGPQQMYDLINNVVKKFLTGPTKENEKFTTGYDGLNINLAWIKWEEAVTDFPDTILGGSKDRGEDGGVHKEPSGVLFAVEDGNLISPEIYVTTLANNPIYYISNEETQRMSELAKERFHYYITLYKKHTSVGRRGFLDKLFNRKVNDENKWQFLVKLGLEVDEAETPADKEHLWFEVQELNEKEIKGTLLNQPYWIASLNEGDTKIYPVSVLTDWIIYDETGKQYTPDSVYQLIEI
jgi:Uncharacterized protein conserved in bacteria (DUF2314).